MGLPGLFRVWHVSALLAFYARTAPGAGYWLRLVSQPFYWLRLVSQPCLTHRRTLLDEASLR